MSLAVGRKGNVSFATATLPGKSNEDRYTAYLKSDRESAAQFMSFGVFDGHSGSFASETCCEQIHRRVERKFTELRKLYSAIELEENFGDSLWKKSLKLQQINEALFVEALQESIIEINSLIYEEGEAGTTMTNLFLLPVNEEGELRVILANCGDSRCVMAVALSDSDIGQSGQILLGRTASVDHSAEVPDDGEKLSSKSVDANHPKIKQDRGLSKKKSSELSIDDILCNSESKKSNTEEDALSNSAHSYFKVPPNLDSTNQIPFTKQDQSRKSFTNSKVRIAAMNVTEDHNLVCRRERYRISQKLDVQAAVLPYELSLQSSLCKFLGEKPQRRSSLPTNVLTREDRVRLDKLCMLIPSTFKFNNNEQENNNDSMKSPRSVIESTNSVDVTGDGSSTQVAAVDSTKYQLILESHRKLLSESSWNSMEDAPVDLNEWYQYLHRVEMATAMIQEIREQASKRGLPPPLSSRRASPQESARSTRGGVLDESNLRMETLEYSDDSSDADESSASDDDELSEDEKNALSNRKDLLNQLQHKEPKNRKQPKNKDSIPLPKPKTETTHTKGQPVTLQMKGRQESYFGRRMTADGSAKGPLAYFGRHNRSLLMTRSIGDKFGPRGCICVPDLAAITITPQKHVRFILASDGMWDVVDTDTVRQMALNHRYIDPASLATALVHKGSRRRVRNKMRVDDITVTVVDINSNYEGIFVKTRKPSVHSSYSLSNSSYHGINNTSTNGSASKHRVPFLNVNIPSSGSQSSKASPTNASTVAKDGKGKSKPHPAVTKLNFDKLIDDNLSVHSISNSSTPLSTPRIQLFTTLDTRFYNSFHSTAFSTTLGRQLAQTVMPTEVKRRFQYPWLSEVDKEEGVINLYELPEASSIPTPSTCTIF